MRRSLLFLLGAVAAAGCGKDLGTQAEVSGRLIDEAGKPIAGAGVIWDMPIAVPPASPGEEQAMLQWITAAAVTDRDGGFRMIVPSGERCIELVRPRGSSALFARREVALRPGERRDFGAIEAHHRPEPSSWSWEMPQERGTPRRTWTEPTAPPGDPPPTTMRIPLTEAPARGCLLRLRYR
jgi:hypothetical protein